MEVHNKYINAGLLVFATIIGGRLISAMLIPRSRKRVPPVLKAWPVVGGLVQFLKGPIAMLRQEYPKLGSVLTVNVVNKPVTFLIGPEVSYSVRREQFRFFTEALRVTKLKAYVDQMVIEAAVSISLLLCVSQSSKFTRKIHAFV